MGSILSDSAVKSLDGQEVIWQAQPRQAVALSCPAFELCYGGAKGGGKTDFLVIACIYQIALCHEKWIATGRRQRGRYIIFRKNLKNLADILVRQEEIYPAIDPKVSRPTQQKNYWEFSSGYRVENAHLDGPTDHLGYHGQELTGLGIDQAEEISEAVYLFLTMQVRSKDADMRQLLFVRVTANPGGPHAAWIKDYFIRGCVPHNTIIKTSVKLRSGKERDTTKAFVPATLYDNKYLCEDGAYEASLMKLPEHLRRMYLEGDWDVVVGAYFAHVWQRAKHVIPSFSIPASWPIKFGLDWGTSSPSCVLFAAKDNDGNIYFIDELYQPGITGRTFGEAMLKKLELQKWSRDKKWTVKEMYGVIDRQAMAATGSDGAGPSTPAAGIQWCGWRIFPANKDRAAGIEQWLERLLLKPNGKPSVFIFGDRCPKLASTMPQLMADAHNPNDVATDGDDHAFDAGRFLLMDWPVSNSREKKIKGDRDVERWLEIARQRQANADEYSDTIHTGYGD
jgi:hypothetical protein